MVVYNEAFVFGSNFDFSERTGKKEYFSGEGDTNFVPDLAAIELKSWGDRGGGGINIMFVLADGTSMRAFAKCRSTPTRRRIGTVRVFRSCA